MKRDKENALIFGVCAGIANHLGVDPIFTRIAMLLLCLAWGSGILLYILAAILMPSE